MQDADPEQRMQRDVDDVRQQPTERPEGHGQWLNEHARGHPQLDHRLQV